MDRPRLTPEERERYLSRLKSTLMRHIGRPKRIGMGALFREVTGRDYRHRINDTRLVRRLVTELRAEGMPICSEASNDGGYWLASADYELEVYLKALRGQALKKLQQEARIRKISMPALIGQLSLDFEKEARRDA